MMKRYCIVFELKEKYVNDYCELHRNPWSNILDAMKTSGAKEILVWKYNNFSIIYFECEDIYKYYKNIMKFSIKQKWDQKVKKWLKYPPKLDEENDIKVCEKIFDLNQQINGNLFNF